MSYRYFLLGDVVPVRVAYDAQGRKIGAEVPDRETGQLLQRATYLGRIDHSFEVEEITAERFHALVEDIANRGAALPAIFSSIAAAQLSQPMAKQVCRVLRRITDRQWHILRQAERQRNGLVDIPERQLTLQETDYGLCRTSLKADSETIRLSMDYIGPARDDPQGYTLEVPRADQARFVYAIQSITGMRSLPGVDIDAALIAACRSFFDQAALGFGALERLAPSYGFSARSKVKWHWRANGMMESM